MAPLLLATLPAALAMIKTVTLGYHSYQPEVNKVIDVWAKESMFSRGFIRAITSVPA